MWVWVPSVASNSSPIASSADSFLVSIQSPCLHQHHNNSNRNYSDAYTHTHPCTHECPDYTKWNGHTNGLEVGEDNSKEQKTWQIYCFEKKRKKCLELWFEQVLREFLLKRKEMVIPCRAAKDKKGMGTSSEKSCRVESMGRCVKLKTVTEIRQISACRVFTLSWILFWIGSHLCTNFFLLKCWQPYCCLDRKILHTLTGIGSAALAAAVPYQGKATQISVRGNTNYFQAFNIAHIHFLLQQGLLTCFQENSNVHIFVTAGRPPEMHYLPLIQATMTQFGPECENTIFNLTWNKITVNKTDMVI